MASLGTHIAKRFVPHFATVRDPITEHENARRDELGATLVNTRFTDVQLKGIALEEDLVAEFDALLPPISKPGGVGDRSA